MNINRILREEIEKYIINENVNSLTKYINPLNRYFNEIKRFNGGTNQNVDKFMNDLCIYIVQIIGAIKRCVSNNSLNEGLSDYGIEVPRELGGDFWYGAKRGYYATKNFLQGNGTSGKYGQGARNGVNQNNVKQEKLSVLLSYLNRYQQAYNSVESQIINTTQAPQNALYEIGQLSNEYNMLVQQQNAQGQNP